MIDFCILLSEILHVPDLWIFRTLKIRPVKLIEVWLDLLLCISAQPNIRSLLSKIRFKISQKSGYLI